MKVIVLTSKQWDKLKQQLDQDHPPAIMLLRYKRREVLGFTERHYRSWVKGTAENFGGQVGGYFRDEVHLDFYDEAKQTFFMLKYGDYLERG